MGHSKVIAKNTIFLYIRTLLIMLIQRFLNFEKGKGNNEKVRDIFNISLYIHIVLGLVFGILVYIFGSLYIPHYLVLPEGALDTVMFVF